MSTSHRSHEDSAPSPVRRRAVFLCFLIVAVGVRLGFMLYTERTWEDALITLRHAETAAAGHGLTHHPSHETPIHGFTSPISVLIPMLAEWIVPGSGLLALKLSSLVAAVLTIWLGYRIARHRPVSLSPVATAFFLGYLALDHQQILFGMAGMETQWIVAITLFGLLAFLQEDPLRMGVACGLALWGRPDGVVLIGAILLGLLLARRWRQVPLVAGIGLAMIVPWLIFTFFYYGTPVPHTVIAKDTSWSRWPEAASLEEWLRIWSGELVARARDLKMYFAPRCVDVNFIRGARLQQGVYLLVAVWGCLVFAKHATSRIIPLFVVAFAAYVLIMLPFAHGWYLMPWLGVIALTFAAAIDWLINRSDNRLVSFAGRGLLIVYLALYAFCLVRSFPIERRIQACVENEVRVPAGQWLADHVGEHERIALECVGYLGYYSNRRLLDWPGLVSPRSVAVLSEQPREQRNLSTLIHVERPEWIAVRPRELEQLSKRYPETRALYLERARFRASDECLAEMQRLLWLDDTKFVLDKEFVVLRRSSVE